MRYILFLCLFLLAACEQDAVIFAPTPLPPDSSPVRYTHPGGGFSLVLPRGWSVYEQNTSTLATTYFTPPDMQEPIMQVALIHLQTERTLTEIINAYQSELRPDIRRYSEQERQPMGDGSWRFKGIRQTHGGIVQQVNTFISQIPPFVSVIDVVVPPNAGQDADRIIQLESIINSVQINPDNPLQPAPLATLSLTASSDLEILNVHTWSTPQGIYFITGEATNQGRTTVYDLPVYVQLQTADGITIAESFATVMGYGIPPGGFAPFSLRFGQGQPPDTTQYVLTLGSDEWRSIPPPETTLYSADILTWTDDLIITDDNALLITGEVTNNSEQITVYDPLATVTVINTEQQVIAASFTVIHEGALNPGETRPFTLQITEYGGEPADYIVSIQALPDA